MMGIRLLMAISLACSLSAFAQTQDDRTSPLNDAAGTRGSLAAKNSEPWKILSESPSSSRSTVTSRAQSRIGQLKDPFPLSGNPSGPLLKGIDPNISVRESAVGGDTYCLAIRSYVVARDSKNSDSVHPVGYTTCVPASRFRLRTADIRDRSER